MLWQCRLCGSQNERTDAPCGVCGKGVYPADAVVAAAGVAEPVGRRGVGAVITPGGAPAGPPDGKGVAATPAATPAAPRRSRRRAVIVILVLLILIAIAVVAIAIAAEANDPYGAPGALGASMVFLPVARWPGPAHPPADPPADRPAPRERGGIRAS